MQLSQERINEIKASQPELWKEKIASGLSPQIVAAAILSQVEHDAKHPPEAEALRRVKGAASLVQLYAGRLTVSRQELERLLAEVREQFPDIQIEIAEEHPALAGADMTALMNEVEAARARNRDLLVKNDELSAAVIAAQGAKHEALAAADKHLADLKGVQEKLNQSDPIGTQVLLTKLRGCNNIKEVRDAFAAFDAEHAPAE